MASVAELRPRAKEEFTSALGMIIFLASWAMMFSALFFAYGFIRTRALSWPPVGMPRLPVLLPALNTAILLVSSLTFARGLAALRRGRRAELTRMVAVTFVLGAAFLALQVHVWRSLVAAGLTVQSGGVYSSVFYALTVFHALHVVVGLFILLWVFVRSLRGTYTEHNHINVRLCTMFWHFVDVVWVLMFLTLYVF
jgi:cytochrome c oxidase subunit III